MVARVAELALAYEPGTVLHYSIGFDVMAVVIERVTGKPYGAFLEERLFGPLDMTSTGFRVAPRDAARLTTNYDATGREPAPVTPDPAPDSLAVRLHHSKAQSRVDTTRASPQVQNHHILRARCASRWRTLQKRTPIERDRHGR
jgi:CubicO group peptidase (beta-lactamase class C family)